MIRFFINAVALFYFFGKTIQTVYMPESSFLFIIFPAAILLCYSLYTTLQKRARFLEIIFPWIITTYFIAVILSFIGIEKAMQIGNAGELWQGILSDNIFRSMGNGYLMLLCSSPIEFLLFLRPAAEERGTETKNRKVEDKNNKEGKNNREGKDDKAIRDIITAVAGAILCNVLFCFLSVRTLGPTLTSQSEWPVIKMMQLIRMPGGFLERFDILPINILDTVHDGGFKRLSLLWMEYFSNTLWRMFEKFFRNYFCLLSALDLRCGKTHSFVDVLSQI